MGWESGTELSPRGRACLEWDPAWGPRSRGMLLLDGAVAGHVESVRDPGQPRGYRYAFRPEGSVLRDLEGPWAPAADGSPSNLLREAERRAVRGGVWDHCQWPRDPWPGPGSPFHLEFVYNTM